MSAESSTLDITNIILDDDLDYLNINLDDTSTILDDAENSIQRKLEELHESRNLTLGIDSWTSPLGQTEFNEKQLLKVIEDVGKDKFIAVVSDGEAAIQSAKRRVTNKYPHIMPIRCIAHHINLVTKDIISIEWAKKTLQNCQKIVSFFHDVHRAGAILRNEIKNSFSKGNLKSSVKTRWSTAWDVCESILRQENSIKFILSEQPDIFVNAVKTKAIIQNRQFWHDVEQLKMILGPAKNAVKALELNTTTLADCFIELLKMAQAISAISFQNHDFKQKCIAIFNKRWKEFDINIYMLAFFLHPKYRATCFQQNIFKSVIMREAINIWKNQCGGGKESSNYLLIQLGWFLSKRRTKINIKRLQAMAQMHSYLIMNAKSELKYINDEITLEELDQTLNQVALSINNGIDLFDDENDENLVNFEDINEIEEAVDLEGVNNNELAITNFIDLSTSLLNNREDEKDEEVSIMNHGDLNFDVDELIDRFEESI
ncbi:ribonuclease H-like domain-containing protein [Rhizophagus clarus]|uniref:Ribonuclease H-like domain-containing protein n=1 Tax=Rhizophagus clarus TaxID=94130 RepID=A0A8H3KPF8_9GLOM|nr:ribonuclease H-like domain-containing protein [Rhizophagus clarus]